MYISVCVCLSVCMYVACACARVAMHDIRYGDYFYLLYVILILFLSHAR